MTGVASIRAAHAEGPWTRAAEAILDRLGEARETAGLGFVYVTDVLAGDLPGILATLRARTAIEHWIGTVGIGICATGAAYFDVPAIAVMTVGLAAGSFRVFPTITAGTGAFCRDNGEWIEAARPRFGLVHCDPRNPRTPTLVAEVAESASAFLVGGLTSSRGAFEQVAGEVTRGGLSGVLFAHEVEVATGLSQGCTPLGPVHTVTEGFENVLVRLDDRPALEVLKADVRDACAEAADGVVGPIDVALPIAASDTGDYVVRTLVGTDPDTGMVAIGDAVAQGGRVMFCRRAREDAEADMARMLGELRGRVAGPPKGGVYIACVGRGPNIFSHAAREPEMIRAEFGDIPVVGFFANGEISYNRLYGYTGILSLFL